MVCVFKHDLDGEESTVDTFCHSSVACHFTHPHSNELLTQGSLET